MNVNASDALYDAGEQEQHYVIDPDYEVRRATPCHTISCCFCFLFCSDALCDAGEQEQHYVIDPDYEVRSATVAMSHNFVLFLYLSTYTNL
jgi:Pyruvate/2-oxoacid:ferredoxin oxidoreductase delta subunit